MSVWDDAFRIVLENGSEDVQKLPAKSIYEIVHLVVAPKAFIVSHDEKPVSDYDREHLTDIILGLGDWFDAKLFRLIAKADARNRSLLRKAYPEHVRVFEEWFNS